MSDSRGPIELCCDMMLGPSYCVHNNGFVMFPPLTHGQYYVQLLFYSGFRLLSSRMVCHVVLLIVVLVLMSLFLELF